MARFVVTGGAGFIGSHLVRTLLDEGASVAVIDDFSTGKRENVAPFEGRIDLFEGSICDRDLVARAIKGADYCLHEAAIPSVPRSVERPWESNRANVEGTINVFLAARDAGLKRVVFASSSAVYGNVKEVPVTEGLPRVPISPYGVSKAADEMYGEAFSGLYDIDIVALRYFNVFGPNQDPNSAYAAVIPKFITMMLNGERPTVDGDGQQSRDFSYIDNVVRANLKACEPKGAIAGIYNVACGATHSIMDLVNLLNDILGTDLPADFKPARSGDIRVSWADISKAMRVFGYEPEVSFRDGLKKTVAWYEQQASAKQ